MIPAVIIPHGRFARLHFRLRDRLPMWVIYRPGTAEYPNYWVARMHLAIPQPRHTRFVMLAKTGEELVEMLPPGLTRLPRAPIDPPEILEVWL